MAGREVVVVATGAANLASVIAGLERAGATVRRSEDPGEVAAARAVVLPGVGAFGPVARRLAGNGLGRALARRVADERPTLAICLGLQVLATASEESPGEPGLGVLPVSVMRFDDRVRVPQLGWNRVETGPGCRLLESGDAYFANSYRLLRCPEGWRAAWSDHDGPFVAALERGPVLACQFHPELSARWGQALIRRWLAAAGVLPC